MRLANKVILITGSGSGIGRSTALLFAREGATVIVNDLDEARGIETLKDIHADGGKGHFIHADVTHAESVEQMVDQIIEQYGHIDVLFNNAGISGVGALHEVEPDAWERVIQVNIRGYICPPNMCFLI